MRRQTAATRYFLLSLVLAGLALVFLQATPGSAGSPAAPLAAPTKVPTRTPLPPPTKRPYVFPTPIFIPTSAPATAAPGQLRSPASPPISTAPTGERTYVVQPGDSAWTIAQKVYGDGNKYQLLLSANGMTTTSRLQVGMVLKVPGQGTSQEAIVPPTVASRPQTGAALPSAPTKQAVPTKAAATGARTPVPASRGAISGMRYELALMALNLLSGILLTGAAVFGLLSYSMFQRARRLEKITMMTRRIRPSYY